MTTETKKRPPKHFRHGIFQIIDEYALAYHGTDTEFYVCKWTNGYERTLNYQDHQAEIDEFYNGEEAYWEKRGWVIVEKDGKRTLTPKHKVK